jgi:signal transduction histidine kinase
MKKILVIEDDESVRSVLEVALRMATYDVVSTGDGRDAIQKAREWLPDLIISDINMPGMDGHAVLKAMREDPALANRQFVLMTGDVKRNNQRQGMDLGADDYLPKPFEIGQLLACVEARLRRADVYQRLEDGMLKRHADLFNGTLPHEIITPLNGILGFAEILKQDLGSIPREEALDMLANIESSAQRLHRTLTNFLMLMNVQKAGNHGEMVAGPGVGAERVAQFVNLVSGEIAGKAGRLGDLAVDADPVATETSEAALKTVVQHLVENACAYSSPGTPVRVSLKLDKGCSCLKVSDAGRGMTREQIDQIGVFTQFDRKLYEQQGLGIGLALVKRLVETQGGSLDFESARGSGTTVTVRFKVAASV